MSYLTELEREKRIAAQDKADGYIAVDQVPGQMFEEVLNEAAKSRRNIIKGSVSLSMLGLTGGMLTACGGKSSSNSKTKSNSAPKAINKEIPTAPNVSYNVDFEAIPVAQPDDVIVPNNYTVDVLFAQGDAVEKNSSTELGEATTLENFQKVAGGHHDGMYFFELDGVDPNVGGLLAINHENRWGDFHEKVLKNNKVSNSDKKNWNLSAVGVSIIEIEFNQGQWQVRKDSPYNRRYHGLTKYRVSGPAADKVGKEVIGTLNNCSSGDTPWGTYLTCEETESNYYDPTKPREGYGWIVEIDPYAEIDNMPVKRTAMGRYSHENSAYLLDDDNNLAFYSGDDSTPGCIYKFIPNKKYNPNDRKANKNLLDNGTLYVAKFNGNGTGEWLELTQGKNGLIKGAKDPGKYTQGVKPPRPKTIDFNDQADVLIHAYEAGRVAGGTLMDRPEWITVGPKKDIYCCMTNNSGRINTNSANPRIFNKHGHIIRWHEDADKATSLTFRWEMFLLAGNKKETLPHLKGEIIGDAFTSPDGIRIDPKNRLWVQTDGVSKDNAMYGHNGMYYIDQETHESKRFLVGPYGCEITGIAYTPDLKNMFVNIQHPTKEWPSNQQTNNLPPRSATIVIRHKDGKPVGAK